MNYDVPAILPKEPLRGRKFHLEGSYVYTNFIRGGTKRHPRKYLDKVWRLGTVSEAEQLRIPACQLCARKRDIGRERRKRGGRS